MNNKIKLLDLFCGAGGAAMGYYTAALSLNYEIEITGIDIKNQPNYPFEFVQSDVFEYVSKTDISIFTHIHASPPCQLYSCSTSIWRTLKDYPDYVPEVRLLLEKSGKPSVMENVPSAPIRPDIVLRGDQFGLRVIRKRHFELINWFALSPPLPEKIIGTVKDGDYVSVFGKGSLNKAGIKRLKGFENETVLTSWKHAMNIHWMKKADEIAESIPPAYTEFIGNHFFETIDSPKNYVH